MSVKLPEGRNLSLSVRRVLTILDYLSDHEGTRGCTLTEIAGGLEMNKSTLFSLLRTLQEFDVVDKDAETDRYKLGLKTLYWAEACLSDMQLRKVASPFLHELMGKVSETVHLVVFEKGEVVYIDKVESPHAIRMVSRIGAHMPAHSTAVGKAFLVYLPDEQVQEVIARGLYPRTANTITTQEELLKHLEEVRRRGYAVDNEENEPQVRCIAAPVFDHSAQIVAAISISGPTIRMTTDRIEQLGEEVKQAAFNISRHLGYRQERG